ncbi:MAG: lipoate--protein ligase family protein [Proteiniphilum sp.]|nr:lipoate--protein ligase family protein [Proteiniphilum sp.]
MNIIVSPSTTSAFNLAAEEYLFSKKGEDYLLLYLNDQSVIIGSNQAVVNEVDLDFCIDNNIRIIRRLSGGGAVYHDPGNINYSFIRDKTDEPFSARFLDPVVQVLHSLDIPAEVRKRKDLWLDGYKISGTASHLSKGRELHHGTLLYDTDLDVLQRALTSGNRNLIRRATASVPSPVINIRSYLSSGRYNAPATNIFFDLFTRELVAYYGLNDPVFLRDTEIAEIRELKKNKYTQRSWNYRM